MASGDPLGELLIAAGLLDKAERNRLLGVQARPLPFASLCYVYGVLGEEELVRALAKQHGVPGVVLGRSAIDLSILSYLPEETASEQLVLPIAENDHRVFVACTDPDSVEATLRELQFFRGKPVSPHMALHVVLVKTIRQAYAARNQGSPTYFGQSAGSEVEICTIAAGEGPTGTSPAARYEALAQEVFNEDITAEISVTDLNLEAIDEQLETGSMDTASLTKERMPMLKPLTGEYPQLVEEAPAIDLDGAMDSAAPAVSSSDGQPTVLIVDDDFATRQLLVKTLEPQGFVPLTASNGGEAVRLIKSSPPHALIVDVMLPQIDGFQICRAVKRSVRYRHIPVFMMSAVIDSGRVTEDVLQQYGADGYFEKPLNTTRLSQRVKSVLAAKQSNASQRDDASFKRAMALFREERIEEAMLELKRGLEIDPLSAKHHFVLANLLQKQEKLFEAIDEYETTVDLMPDYFPALTRLAYLYYKKGYSAKAIETWRRALPHCADEGLKKNIEEFMLKLIAEMRSEQLN